MLINNPPQALRKYAEKFNVPESVSLLPGGKSRSSFEDIHITVQTARNRNLKSVILVTSDYHLPRTLFTKGKFLKTVLNQHFEWVAVNMVSQGESFAQIMLQGR